MFSTVFHMFSVINHRFIGVFGGVFPSKQRENRGFFGVEGPPYGVSNLH